MNGVGFNLAITAGVTLVAVGATFGVARLRRRYDTVDTFWGLGFAIVALVTFALSDGSTALRVVVTGLTVVWGVRLSVHLQLRNRKLAEDPRYVAIAERAGANPGPRMFVKVYLFQGVVLWFVSLPVQLAQYSDGFGVTAWLGVALWLAGFGFEAVGDDQLRRFKAVEGNKGKVLDTGLWRYTRHPNYFGDFCMWWGLFAISVGSWRELPALAGPLLMTFILTRGTGARMTDRRMTASRPQYADYVARTSGFIPLPPKRAPKRSAAAAAPEERA